MFPFDQIAARKAARAERKQEALTALRDRYDLLFAAAVTEPDVALRYEALQQLHEKIGRESVVRKYEAGRKQSKKNLQISSGVGAATSAAFALADPTGISMAAVITNWIVATGGFNVLLGADHALVNSDSMKLFRDCEAIAKEFQSSVRQIQQDIQKKDIAALAASPHAQDVQEKFPSLVPLVEAFTAGASKTPEPPKAETPVIETPAKSAPPRRLQL